MLKKTFLHFTVIFLVVFSILTTGCPVKLSSVKDASKKVATYSNAGVDLTRELFRSNFLTLAQKDAVADKFIDLAKAGIAFDLAVHQAEDVYGSNVPRTDVEKLFAVFDSQVVDKFLAVLTSLKLIPSNGSYGVIIESIKAAVLIIAGAFGHKSMIAAKVATAS